MLTTHCRSLALTGKLRQAAGVCWRQAVDDPACTAIKQQHTSSRQRQGAGSRRDTTTAGRPLAHAVTGSRPPAHASDRQQAAGKGQ